MLKLKLEKKETAV